MRRFVALLRGINISGKNKIAMTDLKAAFEKAGFTAVKTHLNSGNVVFNAEAANAPDIERLIANEFALDIPVFVIPRDELSALLDRAPAWWGSGDKSLYDNLIFLLHGADAAETADKIGEPTAGIEQIEICSNSIFWSFITEKHAKANWWKKTAQAGIGEHLTVRTVNTCRKLITI